ncbi:MAG: carbohydrate kinase family protein [Thiobacillaceae bacterium]|jgi:adenosine kinase|nr:carbohydrate kinase family protein [Thiobacillaceae bacterium]
MTRALVCGSMAYDTIMVFHDRFKNHILPEQIHILNVSFLVPDMRREFGGCAGNIAYNLKLLGGEPLIMATVGDDFGPYHDRLRQLELDIAHVHRVAGTFTAQAFITTDLDDNQITAFHPGAMNHAHENKVSQACDIRLGIVSPDGRQGMLDHARQFAEAGVPFIFDPGQGMPMFGGEELLDFVRQAEYLTLNDYEAQLLQERTGQSLEALARQVRALIVTLGAQGSLIHADGRVHEIPAARATQVVDPTGCGDAYRAGLIHGILRGYDWPTTGRLAGLLGAIKIASRGGQNHRFTPAEIADRFRAEYGYNL